MHFAYLLVYAGASSSQSSGSLQILVYTYLHVLIRHHLHFVSPMVPMVHMTLRDCATKAARYLKIPQHKSSVSQELGVDEIIHNRRHNVSHIYG